MPKSTAQARIEELKISGLKATVPRLRVIQIFQTSASRHLSAEDVYRALLAQKAGLLERHHFEGAKAVFELNQGRHHDHLVCLRCGRVEEFVDPAIEERQHQVAHEHGFELHEHALALYAVCADPIRRASSAI